MKGTLLVLFAIVVPISNALDQAVTVKGIVNCRGHRQPGTFVQLFDEDSIPVFDDDDLLGSVVADHRGVFCVKGFTDEATTIEPYIYIEHNCGYEGLNEKRVFTRVIPEEYITEGTKAKRVYHVGDIELLTADAPVQTYDRRIYIETSIDERIRQCIPIYVQYKRFYEKTVVQGGGETAYVLPTDNEVRSEEPVVEPVVEETTTEHIVPIEDDEQNDDENTIIIEEERIVAEEERRRLEEVQRLEVERQKLDEIRRLEEEKLRLEEIRRIEEEKLRIEEIRRQEEENQRIELERREEERRLEEERRAEEERRRLEEVKAQEDRRREQEEEHKRRLEEYHRREQERQEALRKREEEIRRREEEEAKQTSNIETPTNKADPCVQYPVLHQTSHVRSLEMRHEYIEDPCLRK